MQILGYVPREYNVIYQLIQYHGPRVSFCVEGDPWWTKLELLDTSVTDTWSSWFLIGWQKSHILIGWLVVPWEVQQLATGGSLLIISNIPERVDGTQWSRRSQHVIKVKCYKPLFLWLQASRDESSLSMCSNVWSERVSRPINTFFTSSVVI